MNKDRKAVIIDELIYWKQNKLLPEQYCDFLLTLYTQGEEIDNSVSMRPADVNIKTILLLFAGTCLVPVLFFMVLYSKISFVMQLIILIVSLFFSRTLVRRYSNDIKAVSSIAEINWFILLAIALILFMEWVGVSSLLKLWIGIIYFIFIALLGWKNNKHFLIYTAAAGIIFSISIIFF